VAQHAGPAAGGLCPREGREREADSALQSYKGTWASPAAAACTPSRDAIACEVEGEYQLAK